MYHHNSGRMMRMAGFSACITILVSCVAATRLEPQQHAPKPPHFPDAFEMKYVISLPYMEVVQPQGLSYPVHVWYDKKSARMRVDVYDGLDSVIYSQNTYTILPRVDETVCYVDPASSKLAAWPHAALLQKPLPNLRGWHYGGRTVLRNRTADVWRYEERVQGMVSSYVFHVDEDGSPLRLHQLGFEYFQDSHFDEYIYDFEVFKAGPVDNSAFEPPRVCDHPVVHPAMAHAVAAQHLALLPSGPVAVQQYGVLDRLYSAWSKQEGRFHSSPEEYTERAGNFRAAARHINDTNAQELGYKQRLNRFADWSRQEFEALMLPNRARRDAQARRPRLAGTLFNKTLTKKQLPRHVDWRGTGADTIVKDQAMCGSCWAFGAAGTMEAAWYLATGQSLLLSEQQLMDCSYSSTAGSSCWGGDYHEAIRWLRESGGGAATAEDYPYMAEDAFCRTNVTPSAFFEDYIDIPSQDEVAVMDAVYRLGPLAVSVDASQDSFRFYSEGVYHDQHCGTGSYDLDHAVILSGYGTTADGIDYWLVKNTWSRYYGEDGYIKIRRQPNDCGIATEAMAAVVDRRYARGGGVWASVINGVTEGQATTVEGAKPLPA